MMTLCTSCLHFTCQKCQSRGTCLQLQGIIMTHVYRCVQTSRSSSAESRTDTFFAGPPRTTWIGILFVRSLFSTLRYEGLSTRAVGLQPFPHPSSACCATRLRLPCPPLICLAKHQKPHAVQMQEQLGCADIIISPLRRSHDSDDCGYAALSDLCQRVQGEGLSSLLPAEFHFLLPKK